MNGSSESLVAALFKCLFVGAGVALTGLVVCALTLPILLSLREPGLLALLVLLPLAAYFTWRATGRYLAGEPNRCRAAIGLGSRYFVVGAALGLFLKFLMGGWISDTALFVFLGSVIGTIGGSFGGAVQGWIQSRASRNSSKSAPR
jgi:Sec-independent protein secretion pathway component TatC